MRAVFKVRSPLMCRAKLSEPGLHPQVKAKDHGKLTPCKSLFQVSQVSEYGREQYSSTISLLIQLSPF